MFYSSKKYIFFAVFLFVIIFTFKINKLLTNIEKTSKNAARNTGYNFTSSNYNGNIVRQPSPTKIYKILLWFEWQGTNEWMDRDLNELECQYSNCILTADRNQLDKSDAVLFSWRDIKVNDLPNYHLPSQRWVLFNWEPPSHSSAELLEPLNDQINWTMSYRYDSDIFVPYGRVFKCSKDWKPSYSLFDRSKNVAWIVSNCYTENKREHYVKELQKYIDVDIYGRCGQLECTRNGTCFDTIAKNYKFYLSFENSLCKDYVTEKLFRTIRYDIIPVVLGSADYKQIMPFNSYIDVFDFSSPKSLAEYLKTVSSNESMYNSYIQWKNYYCVKETHFMYFCELCKKLNSPSKSKHYEKSDLIDWWYKQANCKLKIVTSK